MRVLLWSFPNGELGLFELYADVQGVIRWRKAKLPISWPEGVETCQPDNYKPSKDLVDFASMLNAKLLCKSVDIWDALFPENLIFQQGYFFELSDLELLMLTGGDTS